MDYRRETEETSVNESMEGFVAYMKDFIDVVIEKATVDLETESDEGLS